ncbi:GGDEF domain-containing protein [Shewanella corallii]|uniref:diguanylate cyclase n=1 Tax=Shewanella corallii TaxID=560080 RepID=A0ABT0N8H7_9GAMM|nr:GGDEF domain-containing protein [Shewanella corallii]MCL2914122.1 GGDEF domain-containing protein [Shewanella corallii]
MTLSALVLAWSAWLEWRDKPSLKMKQVSLGVTSLAVCFACYTMGYKGMIYIFPISFIYFMLFPWLQALIFTACFCVIALYAGSFTEPMPVWARYSFAVFNNLIFAALLARVVAQQKAMLVDVAKTDELTGCLNRKALIPDLQEAIDDFHQKQKCSVILLIDIDHFKSINDTYGHLYGDLVLQNFAEHIKVQLPKDTRVYRYGGEEFLVLLNGYNINRSIALANPMLQMILPGDQRWPPLKVTCSIGIAAFSKGNSLELWLKHADEALYEAKSQGRHRVKLADALNTQLA